MSRHTRYCTAGFAPLELSTALMKGALYNVDELSMTVSAFTKGDLKPFTKAIESGAMVSLKKFETDGYFGSPALIEDDIDDLRHVCRQRGIKYRPSHLVS